jgi:hypothetical protein
MSILEYSKMDKSAKRREMKERPFYRFGRVIMIGRIGGAFLLC